MTGDETNAERMVREAEQEARKELEQDAKAYRALLAALPDLLQDRYRQTALERGRPTEPCECGRCDCQLHTYEGDVGCIWCSNGQHRETDADGESGRLSGAVSKVLKNHVAPLLYNHDRSDQEGRR